MSSVGSETPGRTDSAGGFDGFETLGIDSLNHGKQ